MWDVVGALLDNLGWIDYINMKNVSYNQAVFRFLCTLHVDWDRSYKGKEVLIHLECLTLTIE